MRYEGWKCDFCGKNSTDECERSEWGKDWYYISSMDSNRHLYDICPNCLKAHGIRPIVVI
jgi:hypothetical protein